MKKLMLFFSGFSSLVVGCADSPESSSTKSLNIPKNDSIKLDDSRTTPKLDVDNFDAFKLDLTLAQKNIIRKETGLDLDSVVISNRTIESLGASIPN
jgi:hypothetical protein